MKLVTSRDNALFKQLLRLGQSSRERRKLRQTLLDGVHLVQAYAAAAGAPRALVVSESGAEKAEIAALLRALPRVPVSVFADPLFQEVAPVESPVGVLALIETPKPVALPAEIGSCVILEGVQDPGNLGTTLRTAAAAGIKHVLLSKGCAFAWAPRVIRAGMGAHFVLRIYEHVDVPELLRSFDGCSIALCTHAKQSLFDIDLRGNVAFLIGSEGAGLSEELLELTQQRVSIPMASAMESLNAAVAAAICLFERVRQLRALPT